MDWRIDLSGIETVFLLTDPKNIFISSSLVKEIAMNGGDVRLCSTQRGRRDTAAVVGHLKRSEKVYVWNYWVYRRRKDGESTQRV